MFHVKQCDGCGTQAPIVHEQRMGTTACNGWRSVCADCRTILINLGIILTHCPEGHEYTPDNVRITPKGHRICRTCEYE